MPLDGLWTAQAYHRCVENERPEHAFLVRTWREAGDPGSPPEWRGFVEHLPTKQRRYYRDLADVCAFILTHQLTEKPSK